MSGDLKAALNPSQLTNFLNLLATTTRSAVGLWLRDLIFWTISWSCIRNVEIFCQVLLQPCFDSSEFVNFSSLALSQPRISFLLYLHLLENRAIIQAWHSYYEQDYS